MREKQCKYVNVFVYSFYLSFFFSHPCFFFSSPFANETSMVHHMRSLFAWPRCVFGPSAGAPLPHNATRGARGMHTATFDTTHGLREMLPDRIGALIRSC